MPGWAACCLVQANSTTQCSSIVLMCHEVLGPLAMLDLGVGPQDTPPLLHVTAWLFAPPVTHCMHV